MSLRDYKRSEPLRRYTANGKSFGVYPSAGDVTVSGNYAYSQAVPDFKMQVRAQSATMNADNTAVVISSSLIADENYRGVFDVKPPKQLFLGTWYSDNEHYSSTVEGCDTMYNEKDGIYWRTKNGYNVQLMKNFNSVAPFLDVPLNKCFFYQGTTSTEGWVCTYLKRDAEGKLTRTGATNGTVRLYDFINGLDDNLDRCICTELPTSHPNLYYYDTDNKFHSYYRPYMGCFVLWETTDNRIQAIQRAFDTPIQLNSSLNGTRSSINLFSVPRHDGTGVVPLRPFFPDGTYSLGIYENNYAIMEVKNTGVTYYLKMTFVKRLIAYTGMRVMGTRGGEFTANTSYSTGFAYNLNGSMTAYTPDDFEKVNPLCAVIGELDAKGMGTGNFIRSNQLATYTGKNKGMDYTPENSGYEPATGGDDIDNMTLGRVQNLDYSLIKYYGLTAEKLLNLDTAQVHAPEGFDLTKSIVSLKQIPFNYNKIATLTSNQELFLSGWNTGVSADRLRTSYTKIILGSYPVERKYNNFLDFSPYASYSVYIPLCGWVDLPDKISGNTITVDLLYDITTLACIGVVSCLSDTGSYIVATKSGTLGHDVALTSEGVALKTSAVTQARLSTAGSAVSAVASLASGNATGAVLSALSLSASITQNAVTANKNYSSVVGTTSDCSEFAMPDRCYIKAVYSVPDVPDNYAHDIGHMCNQSGKLDSFSGYTIVNNPDITVNCTLNELTEIKNLLSTGVYI